jgi:hypothetical protein
MQVTYTHLDGTTQTYTANTAITTTPIIGHIWATTWANRAADLRATATSTKDIVLANSTPVTLCYGTKTEYLTDYGLDYWAKERLSSADYANFTAQVASITGATVTNQDPRFMSWWKQFTSDPNVVFTE